MQFHFRQFCQIGCTPGDIVMPSMFSTNNGYENVKKGSKAMKKIWIVLLVIGLVGLLVSADSERSLYPVTGLGMRVKTDVKAKKSMRSPAS